MDKVITINTPGSLETLLDGENLFSIAGLALKGNINATDIWFIRNNCVNLTTLDLSETEIQACNAYDSLHIGFADTNHPSNYIPEFSFEGLKNLVNLKLPTNIGGISNYGLTGLPLETIDLPYTVNFIGFNAMFNCPNLETVICRNPNPVSILDCVFTDAKCPEYGILYVPVGARQNYEIAEVWKNFSQIVESDNPELNLSETEIDGLIYKVIGNYAMVTGYNQTSLPMDVYIPAEVTLNGINYQVKELGEGAFEQSNLESIYMTDSVEVLGQNCFQNTLASKIRLSDNIKILPLGCFYGAINLEELILPSNLEIIYNLCLSNMTSLKSLHIPASVKRFYNHCNFGGGFASLKEFTIDPANEDMCVITVYCIIKT